MKRFARLLEHLAFSPQRTAKRRHLVQYFSAAPDPARGYALAALTGDLALSRVTPSLLRSIVAERVDPELFALSYDFVGDLAETIALVWPGSGDADPPLTEVINELTSINKTELPAAIATRLNALGPSERTAYLKLATGGLRVGVSGRMARLAVAEFGALALTDLEELWHGLAPPYAALFAWAEGGARPVNISNTPFRPVMLSTPTNFNALTALHPAEFAAEWKWDGIRVQAVSDGDERRLYSRTGEDISTSFPDVIAALTENCVLDGELLIRRGDVVAPFNDLQKRLGRKTVSTKMLTSHPAALRVYDILLEDKSDLREQAYDLRRQALKRTLARLNPERVDLSPTLPFTTWDDIAALRAEPGNPVIEGVMLKCRASPYLAGRIKGHWFKWKRDPMLIDAVLMYAQRGHGKRSGYYSDFTFGVWDGDALVPVGKAYFGFTDAELKELDRFVRTHTTERFGPVRAVAAEKVVEIAFEGLARSPRHKSGVAMRFPRINRLRDDKPAAEADTLETVKALLPS